MKKKLGIIIIWVTLAIIFITNFTSGTYLAGWDNLMPELNIWLNLKRSFFAVWQEYQGLGLVSGMGHATDLVRQIILLPLTTVLPQNLIRYLWTFAMMALGTFGIYKITKSFLASLFYLLNFGVIQIFWVPYEAFVTFFGFFPYLIFSFSEVLKKPERKNWIRFTVVNLLAIPSFYIQTLFVVYILSLTIISLSFIKQKNLILKSYLIIFLINAFWLLPFAYFLITNSHHPQTAIINRLSSEETFLRNQYRGKISDFLLLRGYYFDFSDAGEPLVKIWQEYFGKPYIPIIGYLLAAISVLGLTSAPNWLRGIFLLSAVALLSSTPPFSWINYFLRQSPFMDQVFRSPFTKFIVPAAFSFSLLFANGLKIIFKKLKNAFSFQLLAFICLIVFSFPVFNGNLIYSKMRVKIPNEYQELFDFFKDKPKNARIANLPQGPFWGWSLYNWGLRGSGFIWYGIEQPIMDRAFDVWNLNNERYYFELNYALQNRDINLLESVFEKYFVEYVVFDDQIIFPGEKLYAKQALKTQRELLKRSKRLTKVAQFGEIDIYRFDQETTAYLSASQNTILLPDFSRYQLDMGRETIFADLNKAVIYRCNESLLKTWQESRFLTENGQQFLRLSTKNDNLCAVWWLPEIDLSQGWLVEYEYRNITGHPPTVSAWNEQDNLKFFYEKLDDKKEWQKTGFVIPPFNAFYPGVTFSFSNTSFSQNESISDIKGVKLIPITFDQTAITRSESPIPTKTKSNIWFHKILNLEFKISNEKYLIFPQSYDPGWLAFYFEGAKPVFLKNHVMTNNWANAWEIKNPETIYIIFWPQILEFVGFVFIPLALFLGWRTKLH